MVFTGYNLFAPRERAVFSTGNAVKSRGSSLYRKQYEIQMPLSDGAVTPLEGKAESRQCASRDIRLRRKKYDGEVIV